MVVSMNKYVEKFKRNELLDAEWFCTLFDKNIEDLSLRDALGKFGDISTIGQLIFGKYRLLIIWDKRENGLHKKFLTDSEMADYINKNPKDSYCDAIKGHSSYVYILNIVPVENFGAYDLENNREILTKQLCMFIPIIQKFMVDALTNALQTKKQE